MNILTTVQTLINKIISWVDKLLNFGTTQFGNYSMKYSKLLVYGLLIFLLAKIFKVKLNADWKVGH